MTERLLLGVDGGNSKTIALLARADGTIVGAGRAGACDHYASPTPAAAYDEVATAIVARARGSGCRCRAARQRRAQPCGRRLAGGLSRSTRGRSARGSATTLAITRRERRDRRSARRHHRRGRRRDRVRHGHRRRRPRGRRPHLEHQLLGRAVLPLQPLARSDRGGCARRGGHRRVRRSCSSSCPRRRDTARSRSCCAR